MRLLRRKNMKAATGLIADRVIKFDCLMPLPALMEPRGSSYFVLQSTSCHSIIVGFEWEAYICGKM